MHNNNFDDIIGTITSFEFSTDFIDWISNGNFVFSILSETNNSRTYTRSIQFTVRNMTVLNGIIKILKNSVANDIFHDLLRTRKPIGRYITLNPEARLSKHIVFKNVKSHRYHIISNICYRDRTCGHCSEVFNLDYLSGLFLEKQSTANQDAIH